MALLEHGLRLSARAGGHAAESRRLGGRLSRGMRPRPGPGRHKRSGRKEIEMDCVLTLAAVLLAAAPHMHAAALDTSRIQQLTGAKGKLDHAANVFKVSAPRSD